jgi:hypothetical protein
LLIEKGKKAYISDKIVDGSVVKATEYIYKGDRYIRVGQSVSIKKPYTEIKIHNVKARYSFDADTETIEAAVNPSNENVNIENTNTENVEVTETSDAEVTTDEVVVKVEETVEPTKKVYTFIELKQLNKQEQNEICKELGLKGYHNLVEDDRIEMILKA